MGAGRATRWGALVALACLVAGCSIPGHAPDRSPSEPAAPSSTPVRDVVLPGAVLFERTTNGDTSTLYLLRNGRERQLSQPGEFSGIAVSPDHVLVLGMSAEPGTPVRGATYDLRNRTVTPLHVRAPGLNLVPAAWSPDGRRIAYLGWDDSNPALTGIYTAAYPTGRDLTEVLRRPGRLQDEPLQYSPDGRWLLFYRGVAPDPDPHIGGSLWIVPAAGGKPPHQISGKAHPDDWAAWSPYGSRIVFASERLSARGAIWTVEPDGSRLTKVFEDVQGRFPLTPIWSPDGSRILFGLDPHNDQFQHPDNELYVLDADGTHLQRVLRTPDFKRHYAWWR